MSRNDTLTFSPWLLFLSIFFVLISLIISLVFPIFLIFLFFLIFFPNSLISFLISFLIFFLISFLISFLIFFLKALDGLVLVARVASAYRMFDVFDSVVVSLCNVSSKWRRACGSERTTPSTSIVPP